MSLIASIIAPVFALVLMGAAARRWCLVRPAGLHGLNDLVFYAFLPCTLFTSVTDAGPLRTVGIAVVYFAGCLIAFGAGILAARTWLGARLAPATIVGLNGCYGNTVMLGIPIIGAAFGPEGVATLLPIVALHSIMLLPLATLMIELDGQGARPWRALRGMAPALARNPIILSILLAFSWRMLGVPLPGPVHRLLGMLGACGPTLALFCLGASLVGLSARKSARESIFASALKLAVTPLLVWGLARLAGFGPVPTAVAVITAGMPTGANAFLLARSTAVLAETSAGTVVLSTALSVLTLSILLAWLG